jgi:hypothetical protein
LTIFYSSIASVFVLPTFLVLWAKRNKRNERDISGVMKDEQKEEMPEIDDIKDDQEGEKEENIEDQPSKEVPIESSEESP